MSRSSYITSLFSSQFSSEPEVVIHAPGRVNLIGEFTDFNQGFVLPAAINYGTDIAASKRQDRRVRVYAQDCDQQSVEFSLNDIQFNEEYMWVNYVAGTLKVLMEAHPDIGGADLVVSGNVPQGAGLSSSASFEVAVLKTFVELYNLDVNGTAAALMGQDAENNFVGCNCGIMDQLISALGKEGHAMLLDCRDLTYKDAPMPAGYSLVIVNSNVKRGLVDSEYNARRQQCEDVAAYFNLPSLRDVDLGMLQAEQSKLEPELYKRALHVVEENARTQAALTALQNSDMLLLNKLMKDSHVSLRDNFEVTIKQTDGLVTIIDAVLGTQGGVRMTGGGFGGCVVAIAPNHMVEAIQAAVNEQYPRLFDLQADIYVCTASQGAFRTA